MEGRAPSSGNRSRQLAWLISMTPDIDERLLHFFAVRSEHLPRNQGSARLAASEKGATYARLWPDNSPKKPSATPISPQPLQAAKRRNASRSFELRRLTPRAAVQRHRREYQS